MKFDQAINEGFGRYVSDQESKMIPVSEDVLKKAAKVAYHALGTTTYGQNQELMKLYHDTYIDLKQALRSAGVESSEDEDFEDQEGVTDETQGEAEALDDVNTSALDKALELGKKLKSPAVHQALQGLVGTTVQKIKDVESKMA